MKFVIGNFGDKKPGKICFSSKQFSAGVLNAFLVCPPCVECCVRLAGVSQLVSGLVPHIVFQLIWDAVSGSLSLSPSLSPVGCRVRLLGFVFQLVSGLVFHLVFHLGCCVCLMGFLSPVLSPSLLHLVWDAVSPWVCLSVCLRSSLRSSPTVFSSLPSILSPSCFGTLCPPTWVSVPALRILFATWFGMLCVPPLGLSPGFSPILSFSLSQCFRPGLPPWACLPACYRCCVPSCFRAGLGCCVLGLSPSLSRSLFPSLFPSCPPAGLGCCLGCCFQCCSPIGPGCCVGVGSHVPHLVPNFISKLGRDAVCVLSDLRHCLEPMVVTFYPSHKRVSESATSTVAYRLQNVSRTFQGSKKNHWEKNCRVMGYGWNFLMQWALQRFVWQWGTAKYMLWNCKN